MATPNYSFFFKKAWSAVKNNPPVPNLDPTFQAIAWYCLKLSQTSNKKFFAFPIGITAEVTGIPTDTVHKCFGRLIGEGFIRVAEKGGAGKCTRYEWLKKRTLPVWLGGAA
jgi:hypothetical protein